MIGYILAFFGYVKVPKEAIIVSIAVEDFIKKIVEAYEEKDLDESLMDRLRINYRMAQSITQFLRSGRLISYKKNKK